MGFQEFCLEAGQILKGYLDDPKRLEEMREKVFKVRKAFMWNDQERLAGSTEGVLDAQGIEISNIF